MAVERKVIKINFCGCGNEFKSNNNLVLNILKKYYIVEISENPDYVICGIGGNHFEYMKYDCVRILLMTENLSPDFTVFDYCIGFDYLDFGDRYFLEHCINTVTHIHIITICFHYYAPLQRAIIFCFRKRNT